MSAPKLPDGLPPLPEGAVYLPHPDIGKGAFHGWSFMEEDREWELGKWYGTNKSLYYAAPIGSEIARLNGHGAEPTADSKAVALVRKLAQELTELYADCPHDRESTVSALAEAEAFLKRRAGK